MPAKTQIFGDQIVNGSITNAQISASATIDASKITPPGSSTQLIYNNAGAFAASSAITLTAPTFPTLNLAGLEPLINLRCDSTSYIQFQNLSGSSQYGAVFNSADGVSIQSNAGSTWTFAGSGTLTVPGAIDLATHQIHNVVNPSAAQDAATKNYVDGGAHTVAGSNTQLQFNNSGVFGASSGLTWNGTTLSASNLSLTTPLPVASGGTGTTTPGLVAGTNITSITGTWPNQTINAANQTTSPGGSTTQIQYNNAGAFAGASSITTNGTSLAFKDSGSNTISIQAPTTISSSYTLKFPTAQGSASTALTNDGSGNLSWGPTGTGSVTQNTYTVGTASGTYTGSTTLFNLPFTYTQDGKSLQVMYNGQVLVSGVDYAETSNTSVTFTNALTVGYTTVFRFITPQSPSNTSVAQYANFVVGTASGTYTGSTTVYNLPFAYTQDTKSLQVFYDGVQLVPGDDYTETTSTSITTTQALTSSQKIAFRTISTIGTSAAVTALRENYVVGTASGNYTGSTTVFNLINSYTPGGINLQVFLDGDLQTVGASVDYLETNSTTVTFNNALVANQKVTFLFSQTVAATGTVTSATANQLAYYASTGSTIAGTSAATVAAGGNLIVTGTATNDDAAAGKVGEIISSATPGVGTLTNFPTSGQLGDLVSVNLTAGDWDVSIIGELHTSTATAISDIFFGVSTTSGNSVAGLTVGVSRLYYSVSPISTANAYWSFSMPTVRISVSATTPTYFKFGATYSTSPLQLRGGIKARRVR